MNLLDAVVTEVLSEPLFVDTYKENGVMWWQVKVKYDCYGVISERNLVFNNAVDAHNVSVGYEFLT